MIPRVVIPVAGRATRLRPWSAAAPKAMLPLIGPDGRLRPVVHWILAEAVAAGIERAALVVSAGQRAVLDAYLHAARDAGDVDLPAEVVYVDQPRPAGLGDAVLRAADFAAGEPVLVMLGDHVHRAAPGRGACAAQLAEAMARHGGEAMVGMQVIGPDALGRCGAAAGEPLGESDPTGRTYRPTALIEKPDPATARRELITAGLGPDRFLAHAGIYAFSPAIFDCLQALHAGGAGSGGEVQLTDAQKLLYDRGGALLYRIDGTVLDTGTPEAYGAAFAAFAADPPAP
ncbi:MAG: sugar phosphate nucleotidyltransferase [Planctomycetota bacterium]